MFIKLFKLLKIGFVFLLFACVSSERDIERAAIPLINNNNQVQAIDIRTSPRFFWMIRPWRDGKLVTLDGWGRYAEISFSGLNRARIKPLVDFPRLVQDGWGFVTWPQIGLIASKTSIMDHLAYVDENKTKSQLHIITNSADDTKVILLDPDEGLVGYQYYFHNERRGVHEIEIWLFIYNYKTDTMISKQEKTFVRNQGLPVYISIPVNDQYMLAHTSFYDEGRRTGKKWVYDFFFFDWRTKEITRNDLTETLNRENIYVHDDNIHLGRRFLFTEKDIDKRNRHTTIKINWDENYSNVEITDISYLFKGRYKEGYSLSRSDIAISADGSWVTTRITDLSTYDSGRSIGYHSIPFLEERVFFHIDERYPNGISMPVYAEDYDMGNDNGAFVQHPLYGMVFAQGCEKEEGLYLRLYKMNDVLTVIRSEIEN